MNYLVDEQTSILISITCLFVFGEILPSAIMTGVASHCVHYTEACIDDLAHATAAVAETGIKVRKR